MITDNELQDAIDKAFEYVSTYETDGIGSGRNMAIHTGKAGVNIFNDSLKKEFHKMEVSNAKDKCEWLISVNKLTTKQYTNISSMLESEDLENFYTAIALIEVKTKEYHKTIGYGITI